MGKHGACYERVTLLPRISDAPSPGTEAGRPAASARNLRRVSGRFSDDLRREAEPLWRAQLEHPFVRGIASGTLDRERFRRYVRQDYLFLLDYARVLSLAAARAPRAPVACRFAELAHETWTTELELHRAFAAEWGIAVEELGAELAAPPTRAYAGFLIRTATLGEFAEVSAALLPCMWGYSELGRRLAEEGLPDEPRYARWIQLYASPEFAELAEWCRAVVDEESAVASEETRTRMRAAFLESSRHELAFWDVG
jgi:thiaminase (transcriptional activator TenA)